MIDFKKTLTSLLILLFFMVAGADAQNFASSSYSQSVIDESENFTNRLDEQLKLTTEQRKATMQANLQLYKAREEREACKEHYGEKANVHCNELKQITKNYNKQMEQVLTDTQFEDYLEFTDQDENHPYTEVQMLKNRKH